MGRRTMSITGTMGRPLPGTTRPSWITPRALVREQVTQDDSAGGEAVFPIIRFRRGQDAGKEACGRGFGFRCRGRGRSIPSRAENAMSQAEFDALMPAEFWRGGGWIGLPWRCLGRCCWRRPSGCWRDISFGRLGMHRVYKLGFYEHAAGMRRMPSTGPYLKKDHSSSIRIF